MSDKEKGHQMNKKHYEEAKSLEGDIKKINHIVTGLEGQSYFRVVFINCGDEKKEEIDRLLGKDYMSQVNQNMIDALTLKRMKLQEQFSGLITL